jgi:molybdopterin-containing oxidoreductase family iron-sulfur binding subunit
VSPLDDGRIPDRHWRSLDELAGSPEFRRFVEDEFPGWADEALSKGDRRAFLKLMGASLALAGMTSCRWPAEQIFPFAHRPAGFIPGAVERYATAAWLGGTALGLVVTSHDGRPTKIEGNPLHPSSLGGTTAIAQASLLDLYDPARSRAEAGPLDALGDFVRDRVGRERGGRGLRILSEPVRSPTLARLRARLLEQLPGASWHEWAPLSRDEERTGTAWLFGAPHRPVYRLDRARAIVSLGDDFLMDHPAAARYARDFVDGRRAGRPMSRLYAIESAYSLTGTMADERIPLPERMVPVWAGCLGANLLLEHGLALPAETGDLARMLDRFQAHPLYTQLAGSIGQDLVAHRGDSLLVAGPRQPAAVHALVHALNRALGNDGETIAYVPDSDAVSPCLVDSIADLARAIGAGQVDTLVVLGGNPAFDAPADLDFAHLFERVEATLHVGTHANETSQACDLHVPEAHWLEAWGDVRDWFGTYSVAQPLIEPLAGGRSAIEVVALLAGEPASGRELVRATFDAEIGSGEDGWRRALHDGLVPGSAWPAGTPGLQSGWVDRLAPFLRTHVTAEETDTIELTFLPDPKLRDGSFANNAWLQELPEPVTKLTWDNALLVGPATARRLGVWQEDLVEVESGGRKLALPVYVVPGHAEGSAAVFLGNGRREGGPVAVGTGFDVYPLRTRSALHWTTVTIARTGRKHPLATTQDHYAIDPLGARESAERTHVLAREMDVDAFDRATHGPGGEHGEGAHTEGESEHGAHDAHLWREWEYDGYKWAMSIDLNACIGCSACVVACQAENNVPVVGKEQVRRGREMLWLRVDRYFHGNVEAPAIAHQPMPCQHCENAPCEQVCPVAATVHDSDGLNVMVYNRCIGTRYCSNNCPYKVRRFNFFDNHRNETPLERMKHNPDVTVRSRGVMEKCTFCIQRIQAGKILARNERRRVADGEVTTACAQACPTRAIAFGDLNDPASAVRRLHEDPRAYSLLEWLAVKPRVRYLTRLRNRVPQTGGAPPSTVHGEG